MIAKRFLALTFCLTAALAFAGPAAAHGGEIEILLENTTAEATGNRYELYVTYVNDGEVVPGASISAVVIDANGAEAAPVPFDYSEGGRYSAFVPTPVGESTVRFVSLDPAGSLELQQTFLPPTTTVPPSTAAPTTAAPTSAPTTVPSTLDVPAVSGGESITPTDGPVVEIEDDSGSATPYLVGGGVALAAVLGVVVWRAGRGRASS